MKALDPSRDEKDEELPGATRMSSMSVNTGKVAVAKNATLTEAENGENDASPTDTEEENKSPELELKAEDASAKKQFESYVTSTADEDLAADLEMRE